MSPNPPDRDPTSADAVFAAWAAMDLGLLRARLVAQREGFWSARAVQARGEAERLHERLKALLVGAGGDAVVAEDKPTAAELRRWLTHPNGILLPFPDELTRDPEAFATWVRMQRAGDALAAAERRNGVTSPSAVRWRRQARQAREELLLLLDTTAEELQSQYSLRTERGRNALALGRY